MSIGEQENRCQATPYQAAGGLEGITRLVDEFYLNMDTLPEAKIIRGMHPPDLTESRRKLIYFLSGWLGGPRLFQQHYDPISIPGAHKRFPIGYEERDAWLLCMQRAIATQPYSDQFKDYLLTALNIPAERVRQVNMGEF
ncbi:MAG: group II truncated hemoglobin [Nitrospira sp.]|nr:group II truncated hemoglobin [Nitrospira sp.]